MKKIIKLPKGSLASRKSAIPIRDEVIKVFNDYDLIIFDLKDVEILSGAFADECIGILVDIFGFDAVKNKVRLINGNEASYHGAAQAIVDRKIKHHNDYDA